MSRELVEGTTIHKQGVQGGEALENEGLRRTPSPPALVAAQGVAGDLRMFTTNFTPN
jgi:hypothetical protein